MRQESAYSARSPAPGSMSRPFTRIVGEPRKRCAAAASESGTSTRRSVAPMPLSAITRLTSSSAGAACGQPSKVSTSTSGLLIDPLGVATRGNVLCIVVQECIAELEQRQHALVGDEVEDRAVLTTRCDEPAPTQAGEMV